MESLLDTAIKEELMILRRTKRERYRASCFIVWVDDWREEHSLCGSSGVYSNDTYIPENVTCLLCKEKLGLLEKINIIEDNTDWNIL